MTFLGTKPEHVEVTFITGSSELGWCDEGGPRGSFVLGWSYTRESGLFGFGTLTFRQKEDGTLECDSELMGGEFVAAVLSALARQIKVVS